ncbi:hypothetical protein Tco_1256745 [Tanacetum coccineum]
MANFPRLDKLTVVANTRGLFDRMLVNCDWENAKDLEFANGLHNLWSELLKRTNERQLFITELEGLCPSVKRCQERLLWLRQSGLCRSLVCVDLLLLYY